MYAASRQRRRGSSADYWPGFVDLMSTLLLVMIFLLVVYMLAQYFLQRTLSEETEEKDERYIFPSGQEPTDWQQSLRQETYRTTAGITAAERVYELRVENDPKSCASFSSEKLSDEPENGYSTVLWRQVCELADGQIMSSLHKTVLGNDQLHILSMIWKEDPPNRAWNQWTNFMNRVYVCDTEREEHPCRTAPAGGPGGMRR